MYSRFCKTFYGSLAVGLFLILSPSAHAAYHLGCDYVDSSGKKSWVWAQVKKEGSYFKLYGNLNSKSEFEVKWIQPERLTALCKYTVRSFVGENFQFTGIWAAKNQYQSAYPIVASDAKVPSGFYNPGDLLRVLVGDGEQSQAEMEAKAAENVLMSHNQTLQWVDAFYSNEIDITKEEIQSASRFFKNFTNEYKLFLLIGPYKKIKDLYLKAAETQNPMALNILNSIYSMVPYFITFDHDQYINDLHEIIEDRESTLGLFYLSSVLSFSVSQDQRDLDIWKNLITKTQQGIYKSLNALLRALEHQESMSHFMRKIRRDPNIVTSAKRFYDLTSVNLKEETVLFSAALGRKIPSRLNIGKIKQFASYVDAFYVEKLREKKKTIEALSKEEYFDANTCKDHGHEDDEHDFEDCSNQSLEEEIESDAEVKKPKVKTKGTPWVKESKQEEQVQGQEIQAQEEGVKLEGKFLKVWKRIKTHGDVKMDEVQKLFIHVCEKKGVDYDMEEKGIVTSFSFWGNGSFGKLVSHDVHGGKEKRLPDTYLNHIAHFFTEKLGVSSDDEE